MRAVEKMPTAAGKNLFCQRLSCLGIFILNLQSSRVALTDRNKKFLLYRITPSWIRKVLASMTFMRERNCQPDIGVNLLNPNWDRLRNPKRLKSKPNSKIPQPHRRRSTIQSITFLDSNSN